MKAKVLIVFGTRPEAIKMAPLIKEFQKNESVFESKVCVTAQHREMLDQVLDFFSIEPDYDMNIMKSNQSLYSLTSSIINDFKGIADSFKPDFVFVHGDTTTSMAVALATFYSGAKVCHVEAGLRTHNKLSPFPEEINRQITARIADYHFAPTLLSKQNLLDENINTDTIFVTGNTVIDSLLESLNILKSYQNEEITYLKSILKKGKRIILVTGHRRENHGLGFSNICEALVILTEVFPDIQIIYPVHPNPSVREAVYQSLGSNPSINLIDPLSYPAFVWLMNESYIVITDSGGVQEEAPTLGKPVLVLRNNTERPEAVSAGTVVLVGTEVNKIVSKCSELLRSTIMYTSMALKSNPYGDGLASYNIVETLKKRVFD
jgi:UDP-N-acetylglucosamine 2-epimerase (non-hydrolysing)